MSVIVSPDSILKTSEFSITTNTETAISALNYTVSTGKSFYLAFFGHAVFAPLSLIVRLKVNGTTVFMITSSLTNSISLPYPAKVASAGDAITVTVEAQAPRGKAWVGFTGIEQ